MNNLTDAQKDEIVRAAILLKNLCGIPSGETPVSMRAYVNYARGNIYAEIYSLWDVIPNELPEKSEPAQKENMPVRLFGVALTWLEILFAKRGTA